MEGLSKCLLLLAVLTALGVHVGSAPSTLGSQRQLQSDYKKHAPDADWKQVGPKEGHGYHSLRKKTQQLFYWDLLMAMPAGRQDKVAVAGCVFKGDPEFPSVIIWECPAIPSGLVPVGGTCSAACPSGGGTITATCQPDGTLVYEDDCGSACFSGAAKVMVRELAEEMSIRDLRTGQHVLCFDGGNTMMTPGAPRWCEVKNFAKAEEGWFDHMVALTFNGPAGQHHTTTVSWDHSLHIITDTSHQPSALSADQLGPFTSDLAIQAKPGQMLAVATSAGLNTTFVPALIEDVRLVNASGKFLPAIEHPFLLVDGVVMPVWSAWVKTFGAASSPGATPVSPHLANAFKHFLMAPLWMTRAQPKGTPAAHAAWDGLPEPHFVRELTASLQAGKSSVPVTGVANFTRAFDWFLPRYQAWKADPSKAITVDDVFDIWPRLFDAHTADTTDASAALSPIALAAPAVEKNNMIASHAA